MLTPWSETLAAAVTTILRSSTAGDVAALGGGGMTEVEPAAAAPSSLAGEEGSAGRFSWLNVSALVCHSERSEESSWNLNLSCHWEIKVDSSLRSE